MRIIRIIILFALLGLPLNSFADQNEPGGFMGNKWRASLKEVAVHHKELDGILTYMPIFDDDKRNLKAYESSLNGNIEGAEVYMYFKEGKLVTGDLMFKRGCNTTSQETLYDSLVRQYKKPYKSVDIAYYWKGNNTIVKYIKPICCVSFIDSKYFKTSGL